MTWQCGDERSSFKMMKSLAKVRNTCRTCATVGKIVQKEKISRNHALSEFLYCAILGLRSPHKKGRLVMVRLREKAEKKRKSSSAARGEHFQVSPTGEEEGGSRGEKRITRRRGLELGGRTDEVYTKVVQEGRKKHSRGNRLRLSSTLL